MKDLVCGVASDSSSSFYEIWFFLQPKYYVKFGVVFASTSSFCKMCTSMYFI